MIRLRTARLFAALAFASVSPAPLRAQLVAERVDTSVNARIRLEVKERSRVFETATMLSDGFGPRLAGSPEYRRAAEWAKKELASYGLVGAALEPWGKRTGRSWKVESQSVEMTAPYYARIVAYPKAWSPSTSGVVRGTPMMVNIRGDSDIVRYRGQLRGKIILNGPATNHARPNAERFEALARRFTDAELDSMRRITTPGSPADYWDDAEGYAESVARRQRVAILLKNEGVAALLEPSGNVNAVGVSSYQAYDSDVSGAVPAFVVQRSDYDRIANLVERKIPVTMQLSLRTRYLPDDGVGYNIVAELPGTDPTVADEVVIVGGHFDAWPAATGATDNAAGSAVAMEAVRILKAIGASPRRTIRVALWDGEEHEDYFGSLGYVKKHFGNPETMTLRPAQAKVSAYFNIDHGTGRVRGIYTQANEVVRPIFDHILAPFADLGATTTTLKNEGSTDHMPFVSVGIPAFTFIQDPIDYESRTHHTNLDVASMLLKDDLEQASIVVASVLYHVANRQDLLPRRPLPPPHAKK
jgi:carboxypeptidase Q